MVEIGIKIVCQCDVLPKWSWHIWGKRISDTTVDTPFPIILMVWEPGVVRHCCLDSEHSVLHLGEVTTDMLGTLKVSMVWHGMED
jgi:hypothetical protein